MLRGPSVMAVVVAGTLGSALCITLANLTLLSKGEVERIWLPFVPWLLVGSALLPAAWRRRALFAQLGFALAVQSLLVTKW